MSMVRHLTGLGAAVVVAAALAPARAQNACLTPNCALGATPVVCQNRASPRTPTVLMTQSGFNNVFNPANPRIEPGSCIIWRAAGTTHTSTGNVCMPDPLCDSPNPPECQWDSANVSAGAANPTTTCSYDAAAFPAGTGNAYYCRLHATPTSGTMRGTLQVTTPIVLAVDKEVATNSIKLSWTGGGVTGDFTYKVARNVTSPQMPAATTTTLNPDGGVAGTTFLDVGVLTGPGARYYLVRNKQTNEP